MLFQGKDGELRIIEKGSASTYYLEILFSEMNFSGPISRPRDTETLIMDRGNFDSNAHYIRGNDEARYAPIPLTFSCRMNDTVKTQLVHEWMSGATKISGTTQLYSFKGYTTIDGNTLPNFKDSTAKYAYRVETLWTGTNNYGIKYEEVYFPPGEQTITESADGVILSCNAQIYGDVTRITGFSSGTTVLKG